MAHTKSLRIKNKTQENTVTYSIDRQLLNESESSITIVAQSDGSYRLYVAKCPQSKTGFVEPVVVKGRANFAKKLVEIMFGETEKVVQE